MMHRLPILSHMRTLIIVVLLCSGSWLRAADAAAGEKVFKANCAACHKVDKNMTGPKLGGVSAKYASDMPWLYSWIKNAPGLIASGDAKAVALYEQYKPNQMQAFPALADADIDNILAWIDAEEARLAAGPVADAGTGAAAGGGGVVDKSIINILMVLVVVLSLIALMLVGITATLVTAVRAKENKEPFRWSDAWGRTKLMLQNKFVITAITLLVLVGGGVRWIEWARGLSLHQSYAPEQPIKFSHKLHAGEYEIDCEYCHSGVRKSKSAWIPSTNVCMNCHKLIQEGPQYGPEEIAKIYQSVGFDPESGRYIEGYEQQPIEWVRIHNLPDHSYFNHAQHVVAGNIECQTCHGPVQEMEVVYQYSTLGMGWCINCHRQEKVKVFGKENPEGITVEDMGGLNCARCHY